MSGGNSHQRAKEQAARLRAAELEAKNKPEGDTPMEEIETRPLYGDDRDWVDTPRGRELAHPDMLPAEYQGPTPKIKAHSETNKGKEIIGLLLDVVFLVAPWVLPMPVIIRWACWFVCFTYLSSWFRPFSNGRPNQGYLLRFRAPLFLVFCFLHLLTANGDQNRPLRRLDIYMRGSAAAREHMGFQFLLSTGNPAIN
jgi:hypothetical protein